MSRRIECIQYRLKVERELKKGNFVEKDGVVYYKPIRQYNTYCDTNKKEKK